MPLYRYFSFGTWSFKLEVPPVISEIILNHSAFIWSISSTSLWFCLRLILRIMSGTSQTWYRDHICFTLWQECLLYRKSIQFGTMSKQDIVKASELHVYESQLYTMPERMPAAYGVIDTRLVWWFSRLYNPCSVILAFFLELFIYFWYLYSIAYELLFTEKAIEPFGGVRWVSY